MLWCVAFALFGGRSTFSNLFRRFSISYAIRIRLYQDGRLSRTCESEGEKSGGDARGIREIARTFSIKSCFEGTRMVGLMGIELYEGVVGCAIQSVTLKKMGKMKKRTTE